MPLFVRSVSRASVTALTLLAIGCGGDGGTGPGPTKLADPLGTAAKIQALNATFSTPLFQSFSLATAYSPAAPPPAAAVRALLRAAGPTLGGRSALSLSESRLAASELAVALAPRRGLAAAPVLPPQVLGKTFEWSTDPLVFGYVATDRPGAPANGVRFILYALDGGGAPIVTQEIGYAEFVDGDPYPGGTGPAQLHIRVVGTAPDPDVTYLDYSIRVTGTAASGTLTVVGFITDGTHRLDFNYTVSGTETSATVDIRFDVNADDAHVRLQITFTELTPSTFRVTIDFRLQFGAEVVVLTGSETVDLNTLEVTGTHTVTVNRGTYATITIANNTPSYTGGGGQQLTADDLAALNAIYEAIGTVFIRSDALLAPVASLLFI